MHFFQGELLPTDDIIDLRGVVGKAVLTLWRVKIYDRRGGVVSVLVDATRLVRAGDSVRAEDYERNRHVLVSIGETETIKEGVQLPPLDDKWDLIAQKNKPGKLTAQKGFVLRRERLWEVRILDLRNEGLGGVGSDQVEEFPVRASELRLQPSGPDMLVPGEQAVLYCSEQQTVKEGRWFLSTGIGCDGERVDNKHEPSSSQFQDTPPVQFHVIFSKRMT